MKKALLLILAALLVMSLASCGSGSNGKKNTINGIAINLPEGFTVVNEYCVGNGLTEYVGRDAAGTIIFDIGYSHGTAGDFGFDTMEALKEVLTAEIEYMSEGSLETMTVGSYEGGAADSNGYAGLSYMADIFLVSYNNDEVDAYNILYDTEYRTVIDSFLEGLK